jgi:hypothetical protein
MSNPEGVLPLRIQSFYGRELPRPYVVRREEGELLRARPLAPHVNDALLCAHPKRGAPRHREAPHCLLTLSRHASQPGQTVLASQLEVSRRAGHEFLAVRPTPVLRRP